MMLTDYNTFRHKDGPALHCAVQPGHPLPGFLGTGEWEWNGVLDRGGRAPNGFKVEVAAYVSDLSGFYFYHAPFCSEQLEPETGPALAPHL